MMTVGTPLLGNLHIVVVSSIFWHKKHLFVGLVVRASYMNSSGKRVRLHGPIWSANHF